MLGRLGSGTHPGRFGGGESGGRFSTHLRYASVGKVEGMFPKGGPTPGRFDGGQAGGHPSKGGDVSAGVRSPRHGPRSSRRGRNVSSDATMGRG